MVVGVNDLSSIKGLKKKYISMGNNLVLNRPLCIPNRGMLMLKACASGYTKIPSIPMLVHQWFSQHMDGGNPLKSMKAIF